MNMSIINNIVMAGIDHSIAKLSKRELFSFTRTALDNIYSNLIKYDYINGVVIISTCNRTEIYLSLYDEYLCDTTQDIDPFVLMCKAMGVSAEDIPHKIRRGEAAMGHLCALSCGMKSQIWGEDQIISQVKNSIIIARENKAIGSVLEVMFRTAVTAAKKVKTEVKLTTRERSVVVKSMDIIKEKPGIKNVLVIGNGEIGRLMAETLVKEGYNATITLRQYTHGMNIVPQGVDIVEYNNRYNKMLASDGVISATLSPHHTVEFDEVNRLSKTPTLFIDLAVPRDIDPKIADIAGVSLFDIDNMCEAAEDIENSHKEQIAQAEVIIQKHIGDFKSWCKYKTEVLNQA